MKFHAEHVPEFGTPLYTTRIPSKFTWMRPLVARLVARLVEEDLLPQDDIPAAEVCVTEALTNAIVHGNSSDPQRWVSVRLFRTQAEWGIVVRDEGAGFTPEDIPDPEDPEFALRDHGRGLLIMSNMMDRIEFYEGGSAVVMTKSIPLLGGAVPQEGSSTALQLFHLKCAIVAKVTIHNLQPSEVDAAFDEILQSIEATDPSTIVLDLATTSSISSRAIGRLVSLSVSCQRLGHDLRLAGLANALRGILATAGLENVFSFYSDTRDALPAAIPQRSARIGTG